MKILLAVLLAALLTSPVFAGGVNLAWTECLGGGGTMNRNFACNTNAGMNRLVVSFVPNEAMNDVVGHEVRLDLQSADATTLNQWWRMFAPGSCRGSSVPAVSVGPMPGGCIDFWAGAGSGGVSSYIMNGNRASLWASWSDATPRPVVPETEPWSYNEYYSLGISITNSGTVGTPGCPGCAVPVCIIATYVVLVGQSGDLQLVNAPTTYHSNMVTWQGGLVPFCPPLVPVPTRERSWGQIKSLYR